MSCAETAIWATMEYFGTRYSEYKPTTPSEILRIFGTTSYQRLLPSSGLTVFQVSRALKSLGLSTRVYASEAYPNGDFRRIINYYIESGIPVVGALRNKNIGHTIVLIGHRRLSDSDRKSDSVETSTIGQIELIDTADLRHDHVIIDDNFPPYQIHDFFGSTPSYYADQTFEGLQLSYCVVPLHSLIHLDAFKARRLVSTILRHPKLGCANGHRDAKKRAYLRFFLTSSSSFKRSIVLNPMMHESLKALLLNYSFPKFIWIAELSDKDSYLQNQALGFIIIDATGSDTVESVELILYPGRLLYFQSRSEILEYPVDWDGYDLYRNNLKGEWCKWESN